MIYDLCSSFVIRQLLERLIIPNCKKIPNKTLCTVLTNNPSLLEIDISNKVNPKVDLPVVNTIAHSCRYLRVLKLSDYRVEDPKILLVLCGKAIASSHVVQNSSQNGTETWSLSECVGDTPTRGNAMQVSGRTPPQIATTFPSTNNSSATTLTLEPQDCTISTLDSFYDSADTLTTFTDTVRLSPSVTGEIPVVLPSVHQVCCDEPSADILFDDLEEIATKMEGLCVCGPNRGLSALHLNHTVNGGACLEDCNDILVPFPNDLRGVSTEEEQVNQNANIAAGDINVHNDDNVEASDNGESGDSDEDLYENDSPVTPLNVEDHSSEYGCLELETLWLDNVNLTDPVAAVLLQSLPRLRDLNLSDTDICNPWRLLDSTQSTHLRLLMHLNVKSTALSRTALELIPKFHPDLQQFSISSTTLPPHTYTNIGKLTGVADLELIGGQFYPSEPAEIFEKGIMPAICAIGIHLRFLNLTYFAHVKFEVIATNCPRLERLDLSHTWISVTYPCVSLSDCCPFLTTLSLAFSHIEATDGKEEDPQKFPVDKALGKMVGQPQNLEQLYLGGLSVSNETIQNIFPQPVYSLKVLDMSRCRLITYEGIQHVWDKCQHLRRVNITHCREITLGEFQQLKTKFCEERPVFKLEGKIDWK